MTSSCVASSLEMRGSGRSLKNALSVLLTQDVKRPKLVMSRVGSAS